MKRVVFLVLLCGFSLISLAQISVKRANKIDLLKDDGNWYEGSILLADGSKLNGVIKYNTRSEVVFYLDGDNAKPFTARNILSFEFFDDGLRAYRKFYSLEQENPSTGNPEAAIFEVLRDYKTFVILLRTSPIDIWKTNLSSPGYPTTSYAVDVVQYEIVCFLDEREKVKPYFIVSTSDNGRISSKTGESIKKKGSAIINDHLFEEYVSPDAYDKITTYAKRYNLKFNKKIEDFMKILEYYDSLLEE